MMDQLQGDTQEDLNDQVHRDVHEANVNKHVGDETPCLVSTEWIVDEQGCCWTVGALSDFLVVVWILTEITGN